MSDKKVYGLAGGLFFTAFLLVVVVFTSQMTQKPGNITRVAPKATSSTGTVTARIDPPANNVLVGDNFSVNVMMNLGNKVVNSITTRISYTYSGATPEIDIVGDPTTNTNLNLNYIVSSVTRSSGKIIIDVSAHSMGGFASASEFRFATLNFVANAPTGTAGKSLTFDLLDSSVVERATTLDVLTSALPTSVVVSVNDNTPPSITIGTVPTLINTRSLNINFSATDLSTRMAASPYAYSLSGGSTVINKTSYSLSGTANLTGLADGNYTFTAFAKDAANNEANKSATFTVDATAPSINISIGPTGTINTNTATFIWSGNDTRSGATVVYSTQFDGGGWSAYSSTTTQTFNNLTNGSHIFNVQAKDDLGNMSVVATKNFTVSTTSSLNFKLKFQSMLGIRNTDGSRTFQPKTVRVKLMTPGATTEIAKFGNVPVTPDATGVYTGVISNIPPGTYDIYVKGFVHKQKNFGTATFVAGTPLIKDWSTSTANVLKAGDMVGSTAAGANNGPNNIIDGLDISLLIDNFAIGVDKTSLADLNGDRRVDGLDISILIDNFQIGVPGDGGRE